MVGRGGLEPPTLRLSGVRSNHLSYRPASRLRLSSSRNAAIQWMNARRNAERSMVRENSRRRRDALMDRILLSNLKGYVDGLSVVIWVFQHMALPPRALTPCQVGRQDRVARPSPMETILRKEVIQPQVPLRLPCYDFTPVAELTVVRCLPCGLAHGLRVDPTPMV